MYSREEETQFFALHEDEMANYGEDANEEESEETMTLLERFRVRFQRYTR